MSPPLLPSPPSVDPTTANDWITLASPTFDLETLPPKPSTSSSTACVVSTETTTFLAFNVGRI